MIKLGLSFAIAAALGVGVWQGIIWLREDAVKDFVREAALAAAEARRANEAVRDRISDEIDASSLDDLMRRAIDGGMFEATDTNRVGP